MADPKKSCYASRPFKFIVDGTPYFIHADLVSLHSKVLDRMINGRMTEAQEGFAVLEDLNGATFDRFIQWAYKGLYSAAEPIVISSACETGSDQESKKDAKIGVDFGVPGDAGKLSKSTEQPFSAPSGSFGFNNQPGTWNFGAANSAKKDTKGSHGFPFGSSSKDKARESFAKRKYTVLQDSVILPPSRLNKDPDEDYTEVFLSHAQMYVLAEKYDIQPLKVLALENLHHVLKTFTLHNERTGDIIELLRYVYANTAESSVPTNDIRKMATDYISYEMETLMKDEAFKDLMIEDGGDLLGDFMSMVAKRI